MMISVFKRVEMIVGKRENADYLHFLLFPKCFQKPSSSESLQQGIVWHRVETSAYTQETELCLYSTMTSFNVPEGKFS